LRANFICRPARRSIRQQRRPLFNLAGEVVGRDEHEDHFGEGLGFAIPVELVKTFSSRDAFAYSADNPNNPTASRTARPHESRRRIEK